MNKYEAIIFWSAEDDACVAEIVCPYVPVIASPLRTVRVRAQVCS